MKTHWEYGCKLPGGLESRNWSVPNDLIDMRPAQQDVCELTVVLAILRLKVALTRVPTLTIVQLSALSAFIRAFSASPFYSICPVRVISRHPTPAAPAVVSCTFCGVGRHINLSFLFL